MGLHRLFVPVSLVVLAVIVSACGGTGAVPPASPPPTQITLPPPTQTPLPATATPVPPTLLPPTNTPLPPTETSVAELPPTRIQFATGATSALVDDTVQPAATNRYVLRASAGQVMQVYLSPYQQANLLMAIWGADGDVLMSGRARADRWFGVLRATQDYYISVAVADGSTAVSYALEVIIPERIQFATGATSALLRGGLPPAGAHNYVLQAATGQAMTVQLTAAHGLGLIVIWGADGTVLISDHADATEWTGVLPSTQDYYIDVRSVADATEWSGVLPSTQDYYIDVRSAAGGPPLKYTLQVIIPPLP